jgi:predicted pyridoxine 5'-phosphate oxidase superfamily flavin-nucleotide-binding protein
MIQLTEEMRRFINNARASRNPCIIVTASPNGIPNAGYIGTVMAFDDGSLAYRDRSGRSPLEHIEANPKVVVLFRDPSQEVGWKFRCTATVHRDGPVYDQVMSRLAESGLALDPKVMGAAVLLQIDQILTLFGEVLQERVLNLRW